MYRGYSFHDIHDLGSCRWLEIQTHIFILEQSLLNATIPSFLNKFHVNNQYSAKSLDAVQPQCKHK